MKKEEFYTYLNGPKELNEDTLHQIMQVNLQYPYFQTAKLLLLKNLNNNKDPNFISELKNVAIECADREKLFYYLNNDRFERFFIKDDSEHISPVNRTELLLHSFLDSIEDNDSDYDGATHLKTQIDTIELNSIVSTDYLAYLEQMEPVENEPEVANETQPMKHQQLVDDFLEKSSSNEVLFSTDKNRDNREQETSQGVDNLLDDDTFLTETLAQVYIKQKKYEQALTIIKRLSLNFPKKSIYFVDQIRFLEYLIFNDKNKKQK
ncbi:MAG: hypothetical protein ACOH2V_11965 [Candidatus Saccharimonadaceae bacterium]